jgi:hypothetical protein
MKGYENKGIYLLTAVGDRHHSPYEGSAFNERAAFWKTRPDCAKKASRKCRYYSLKPLSLKQ